MESSSIGSFVRNSLIFLTSCALYGDPGAFTPWYTGTLEATGAINVPKGQLLYQPYFSYIAEYGLYDNDWDFVSTPTVSILSPQLWVQFGLTDWLDISLYPAFTTQIVEGKTSTRWDDFYSAIGFQLMTEKHGTPRSNMRLEFYNYWPTGAFDKGDLASRGTDLTGVGGVVIGTSYSLSKIFYPSIYHPVKITLDFDVSYTTTTQVRGFSVYGGSRETRGFISPGFEYTFEVAFEVSLTQQLVLAMENIVSYIDAPRFTGTVGPLPILEKPTIELQMIPQVEYSFSPNFGVIGGVWLQYLGRNTDAFASLVFSLVYLY